MVGHSKVSRNGLLEIKLGPCRSGPTRRLHQDLEWAAGECNRVRNAMVRAWLRWREDHASWQPPPLLDTAGQIVEGKFICPMHSVWVTYAGVPVEPPAALAAEARKAWVKSQGGITFGVWLYHMGRRVAPELSTALVSYLSREVLAHLAAVKPSQNRGLARWRWQAILLHEDQVHTWNRQLVIPVPNCDSALAWRGETSKAFPAQTTAIRTRLTDAAAWGPTLAFPVFSASAGREWRSHVARLSVRALTTGTHEQLRKIVRGEWTFRDSKLTWKRGEWYFQLCYRQAVESLGLDADRVAHLWPNPPGPARPFVLETGDGNDFRRWEVGRGDWLVQEYLRLEDRRRALRNRYTVQTSSVRSHGRRRFERRVLPWQRATQDKQNQFCWHLAHEVKKFCQRFNCGSVVYHEPDLVARDHGWWGKRGVPFDWTALANKMEFKLQSLGLAVEVVREPLSMLRRQFEREEHPYGARWPQLDVLLVIRNADGTYTRFRKLPPEDMLDSESGSG